MTLCRLSLWLLLTPALVVSCKPSKPVVVMKGPDGKVQEPPPPPDPEEEAKAQAIAKEAEALEGAGDTAGAEAKRDILAQEHPGTAAGARVLEARARAAREQGRIAEAVSLYERLLFHRPSYEGGAAAREAYGALLLEVGRAQDAREVLLPLYEDAAQADRPRLADLLSKAFADADQGEEALRLQVSLRNSSGIPAEQRKAAEEAAIRIVSKKLSFSEAEKIWDDVKNNGDWAFLHPVLAYKLAKIYYHTREYEKSNQVLLLLTSKYKDTEYGAHAQELLSRLQARFTVNDKNIGVLLPLSGRYKQYGERSLMAIKLALGPNSPYKLVVRDSKGDPIVASKAVEELVLQEKVIAIIGPQFSKPATAAALKAEELSVPILSLSHGDGLPELGEWVFRTALTVQAQAQALAKFAFEKMGWRTFALLYPRNTYGVDFVNAFWDEVDRRKGEIRGVESYENDQTTFSEPVKRLVGRYHTYARPEYVGEVWRLRSKNLPSHVYRSQLEDYAKKLPPVVDFDAIIIPDSGRKVGLLAPALAFEDVVLTRDPKMLQTLKKTLGENVRPVTLMGGSTWNSEQTVQSCERYCEEAVFVDGYWPDNPDPKVRTFVTKFREVSGADPFLADAQAYDTATMVRDVLDKHHPKDRSALRKLLGSHTLEGVTGTLRFDPTGEVQKDLFLLTIRDRAIKRWTPPSEPTAG